jgi:hypothetical protein
VALVLELVASVVGSDEDEGLVAVVGVAEAAPVVVAREMKRRNGLSPKKNKSTIPLHTSLSITS